MLSVAASFRRRWDSELQSAIVEKQRFLLAVSIELCPLDVRSSNSALLSPAVSIELVRAAGLSLSPLNSARRPRPLLSSLNSASGLSVVRATLASFLTVWLPSVAVDPAMVGKPSTCPDCGKSLRRRGVEDSHKFLIRPLDTLDGVLRLPF